MRRRFRRLLPQLRPGNGRTNAGGRPQARRCVDPSTLRHACRSVTFVPYRRRVPGGSSPPSLARRRRVEGRRPGEVIPIANRFRMTRSGSPVGKRRPDRADRPRRRGERRFLLPGTPPESTFPSELPSARSRGLPRAPRSGASATALAAASDGSRTTSDNYGQYGHLGGFRRVDFLPNGSSPFRHGNDDGRSTLAHLKAPRGRWSAGHASALKRPMRRDEPERRRLRRTGLSDAANAGEPAYPAHSQRFASSCVL